MTNGNDITNDEMREQLVEKMRAEEKQRQSGYRELALKLFPHVCGRCGREFEGKKLKELTVHHRDHNHDYNPQDGRNWELLCIYCHDHEHTRSIQNQRSTEATSQNNQPSLVHSPFAQLQSKLKVD